MLSVETLHVCIPLTVSACQQFAVVLPFGPQRAGFFLFHILSLDLIVSFPIYTTQFGFYFHPPIVLKLCSQII